MLIDSSAQVCELSEPRDLDHGLTRGEVEATQLVHEPCLGDLVASRAQGRCTWRVCRSAGETLRCARR
jgi:hypothetical protein